MVVLITLEMPSVFAQAYKPGMMTRQFNTAALRAQQQAAARLQRQQQQAAVISAQKAFKRAAATQEALKKSALRAKIYQPKPALKIRPPKGSAMVDRQAHGLRQNYSAAIAKLLNKDTASKNGRETLRQKRSGKLVDDGKKGDFMRHSGKLKEAFTTANEKK